MEIALVGNPNCGKTTLFNALTGAKQRVGNWSGVTVEKKSGYYTERGQTVEVVDLPGTYSLSIVSEKVSLDEKIACEYLLSNQPSLVVNIIDASHIERSLYLTMQLLEMEIPMIIVVNMLDVAKRKNIQLDLAKLSELIGCPVVGMCAQKKRGLNDLRKQVNKLSRAPKPPQFKPKMQTELESHIAKLQQQLPEDISHINQRWLAMRLLEDDGYARSCVPEEIKALVTSQQQTISKELNEDLDILFADHRYKLIHDLLQQTLQKSGRDQTKLTKVLDSIVLNRILGVPIFLSVMYCMFLFAINIGGAFQDFFDIAGTTIFVNGLTHLLQSWHLPNWFTAIIASGAGSGLTTTLTFIPIIGGMFFFLSLLEGSGYMARAAFVMDRFMRALGLPGKAFVPLIVGFGCNVPAIMATRTLENRRDRILAIMMNPFMSCGARLAIYAVFTAAFFPVGGQNIVFALYLIGVCMAVLTGLLLRKTILIGDSSPLVMELPPYHIPGLISLTLSTWQRLKKFLFKAGKVIVPLCILIGFLNAVTLDGKIQLDDGHQDSLLSSVGRTVTPIFAPMGIQQDNWPATVGIVTGTVAKEVVVATLNTLYTQIGDLAEEEAEEFNLKQGLQEAVNSIVENIKALPESFSNPILASSPESEVNSGIYGQMYQRFDGKIGAFAYLLFLLLYFPCVSTTAVMVKELNRKWTAFSIVWTTAIAYATAVVFYQLATFNRHPYSSTLWVGGIGLSLFVFIYGLILAKPTPEFATEGV